jgi:ubiquinone/menaquinone biosynthesis C-methylase UbiE
MEAKPAEVTPIIKFIYWPGVSKIYEGMVRPFFCRGATPTSIKKQLQDSRELAVQSEQDVILDIACGTGLFTRNLALAVPKGLVVGLDSSMKILQAAHAVAQENGINNVVFVRADVQAMPIQAEAFDSVNCCGALHLFLKPDLALANINHVLKNDKPFSCQTFINSPHFFVRLVQDSLRKKGFNYFDYQELVALLEQQCFSIQRDTLSGHMLTFGAVKTRSVETVV